MDARVSYNSCKLIQQDCRPNWDWLLNRAGVSPSDIQYIIHPCISVGYFWTSKVPALEEKYYDDIHFFFNDGPIKMIARCRKTLLKCWFYNRSVDIMSFSIIKTKQLLSKSWPFHKRTQHEIQYEVFLLLWHFVVDMRQRVQGITIYRGRGFSRSLVFVNVSWVRSFDHRTVLFHERHTMKLSALRTHCVPLPPWHHTYQSLSHAFTVTFTIPPLSLFIHISLPTSHAFTFGSNWWLSIFQQTQLIGSIGSFIKSGMTDEP